MFCCYHDPELALFLSETAEDGDEGAHAAEWFVLYAGVVLAFVMLVLVI